MAITASFSVNQSIGEPENFNLVDSSVGTDIAAVTRRVYAVNAAQQYLTEGLNVSSSPAYTEFPLADGANITLENILPQDSALYITLTYNNVSGGVVATVTNLEGFTLNTETFYYGLTQDQAQQNQPPPMIMQDSNYYTNKGILRTEIDSGNNAIQYGSDIFSAQAAYDRATYLISDENDNF